MTTNVAAVGAQRNLSDYTSTSVRLERPILVNVHTRNSAARHRMKITTGNF